jgi:anaerobic selenocysteine-containing dehydrogenase
VKRLRQVKSFCRVCGAGCGMQLTIDDADRIVDIKGDRDHPMSKGYACFKGLAAAEAPYSPARLLKPLKRMPDGSFVEIGVEQALDEVADKLRSIIARGGPDAVATYTGSGGPVMTATANTMLPAFREAIGTRGHFTNSTIDQSSKFITADRLGFWGGGKHAFEESDVVMLVGTNPLVAHATTACLFADPIKRMKTAKARGLKLIVIDPRETESARFADLFLQPYPGEDPTLISGLLRLILREGWYDKEFCDRYVKAGGIAALRAAVEPFTPDYVERRAGVPREKLIAAAEMFARDNRKGAAFSATGPSMSPRGNIADHLIETISVICGRFRREGDRVTDISVWLQPRPAVAEVFPPTRAWEQENSRIRGAHSIWGEMFTCTLADEIMTPGPGQIRALFNDGGNPATTMPDQLKTVEALSSLELLVTIDPFMTNTAKLSHYIFPPKLQYERADLPMALYGMSFYHVQWGQYQPELLRPPPGAKVVDDWYVFWGICKRLGLPINFAGETLDMETAPTSDDLLEIRSRGSVVPLDVIKQYPGGAVFDEIEAYVQSGRPEADGRFDIMPAEIAAELAEVFAEPVLGGGQSLSNGQHFSHRLAVRRIRDLNNTAGRSLTGIRKRNPYNPARINPADLAASKLTAGSRVRIVSDYGSVPAIVEPDPSVRPGVVMMNHGWGGLPGEDVGYDEQGANVNLLINIHRDYEPINSMARLSAIPVNILPAE